MSNTMLFYKNVTALSRETHKALKLEPVTGFEVASNTHWVPTAGVEFYQASPHYPIVFVADGNEDKTAEMPIILLGLEAGKNDYVAKDFSWKSGTYLPAFIRRYPFVIAAENQDAEEFTLCFDSAFAGFNEKKGKPLFSKDGSNSEFLEESIQFINGFNAEMKRTREFVDCLNKHQLLEKRSAQIISSSKVPFNVQDFLVVSEEKMAKLEGKALEELNQKGYLGWIVAHLMSLSNLPKLLDMHLEKKDEKKA
ncbi:MULTISPECIES: SapC family protein [Rahnella]|uniref:SapC family protein n=1 Tax=Rahnella laticis TaxID=2787622 RepID=A0ABS0DZT2_9GAMM|nr:MULTISPECIES: SapC family protein [Rahnella]MBF7978369.1 SapC family protein [Rahnella laticis]MBF7997914.1 SapC family protein [Rahnella sp. LAC-M12]